MGKNNYPVVFLKADQIKPYKNNPRNNERSVEFVKNSIEKFGFKQPIVVDRESVVIARHTRLEVAKLLNFIEVPCIIADDLTEEEANAYRLADNKTAEFSRWDIQKLEEELLKMESIDLGNFGFDEILDDNFNTDFSLPDEEKPNFCNITFTLSKEQGELVKECVRIGKSENVENFGNENGNGNGLYEVAKQWAKQWAEQRKLF